jgi:HSP20 family molecular chaperone IbpA
MLLAWNLRCFPGMNAARLHNRWIERTLLLAVLAMQVAVFWQLRAVLRGGRAADEPAAEPVAAAQSPESPEPVEPEQAELPAGARLWLPPTPAMAMDAMMENMARLHSAVHFNRGWDRLPASPTLDMRDTESGYLVTFSLPGVNTDDLGVLLEGRVLTVRAWCPAAGASGGGQRYERRILLPGPVGAAEEAQAHLTNGLLRVHVPKGAGAESRRVIMRLF